MVFERIGFLVLVGMSGALLIVVAGRAAAGVRLFLRCLRWGLATGGVTGAVAGGLAVLIGALRGDPWTPADVVLAGGLSGAVVGALIAVIPTLIGAVFVTDLVRQRHPLPAAEEDLRRDLIPVLRGVVLVLDVIVVVALIAAVAGGGWSSVAVSVPFILAGNVSVILMLWRADISIARLWSGLAG